jgi:hypothetical protein
LDFIVINLEYSPTQDAAVLAWADNLLQANSNRRAIIGSHYLIDADSAWGTQGSVIYNMAKTHSNVFLMLCGHQTEEARRTDVYQNNVITTLLSDYQARTNGGNGWMRIMHFSPAANTISVQTYSPSLNQYETDANSQFTINYNLSSTAPSYSLVGTTSNVASGSTASVPYSSLQLNTCYQWYATANDGVNTTSSPVSTFTTAAAAFRKSMDEDPAGSAGLLDVFPNPSHDGHFTILFGNEFENARLIIVNSLGEQVLEDILPAKQGLHPVDLTRLKRGIYFLLISSGNNIVRRKIVIG